MNKTTCPSWEDRRTVDLRGLRVTLSRPILVARSRGFHWFPCIARLGGGDLIATVATTADAYIPQPDAAQYRSRDGGLTWQPLPALQGQFFSSLSLPGGDRVYLPYHLRPAGDCIQGDSFLLPADGGPPQRRANSVRVVLPRKDRSFAPDLGFAGVVFDGQTLRARDGAYLACMYGRFEDDKRYSTILVESPDAVDWRCRSVIAGPDCPLEGEEGPCETTLCRLADGRLMCVFRLASFKPFGQVFSSDDGRSWSPPAAMEALSVEDRKSVV